MLSWRWLPPASTIAKSRDEPESMEAMFPSKRAHTLRRKTCACVEVSMYSSRWLELIPQHGPGRKHRRRITLVGWQQDIATDHAGHLVRGLIHSAAAGSSRLSVSRAASAAPLATSSRTCRRTSRESSVMRAIASASAGPRRTPDPSRSTDSSRWLDLTNMSAQSVSRAGSRAPELLQAAA
jgi:hypothetical protein